MVSGVICEFNPFHNGHKYLLNAAKSNDSSVVCVMSGNFTQRGEIALYEKHIRAQMALKNGADLVISLPIGWSMSGAENFAFGGISLLNSIGIVDRLVFGCENNNIDLLKQTSNLLNDSIVLNAIKKNCENGITFAKARENAIAEISPVFADILTKPNNILAVQYLSSAQSIGFNCDYLSVSRIGTEHDSTEVCENYSSASNIRQLILENKIEEVYNLVPYNLESIFKKTPHTNFALLDKAIMFKLRTLSIEDIKKAPDISEGIENRIFESIKTAASFEELLSNIKTKRYTMARIRRILMCAAFGIDNSYLKKKPPYVKILGYTEKGKELLSEISKKSDIPLIVSAKDIDKLDDFGKKVFESENLSTDLFSLAYNPPINCGLEYTLPIVKI